jgi:hypothetical protein
VGDPEEDGRLRETLAGAPDRVEPGHQDAEEAERGDDRTDGGARGQPPKGRRAANAERRRSPAIAPRYSSRPKRLWTDWEKEPALGHPGSHGKSADAR